jgi:curli production assembly/transport component CsgF
MRAFLFLVMLFVITPANSSELIHQFNSPSFSGVGYSSHALTIYQLEQSARQRHEDRRRQEAAAALRAEQNSPGNQFTQAFQSLVYAQLGKNLSDQLFGENPQNNGSMTFSNVTIAWARSGSEVSMTIQDRATNSTTTITVPIGAFTF